MEAKPVSDSRAQIVHWMGLSDANSIGNVHGGTVMKFCDEAAALAAIKHSRCRVVTVGMDRMNFLVPILIGELVTFSATVNAAWRTSMEVGVRVDAENPRTGESRQTNTAYLDDGGARRRRRADAGAGACRRVANRAAADAGGRVAARQPPT